MRYIFILALLSLNTIAFAQTLQFFNLGQTPPASKHSCLVIKSNSKALKKLPVLLATYQSVTAVKLVGFRQTENLDTVLQQLKQLGQVKELIFENCDLSGVETSFAPYNQLEKLSITRNSTVFENAFFPLLKHNALKKLCIQTDDADVLTDSLGLLTQLSSLQISSSNAFDKANYSKTMQINNDLNTLQAIEIAYFGDFYKPNSTKVRSVKTTSRASQTQSASNLKMDCIKQPIPGIDINDTVFTLNPTKKNNFTYQSGTSLSIDANAFQTQSGQAYNGTVKLFYREFRNPVEIMLSGIPMSNTVNGETQIFKSGGMYEINAYDPENKALKLASDTAIKINFALTDTSETFKFYSLNNDGSWNTETQSVNISKPDTVGKPTIAVREYYKYLRTSLKSKADTTNYFSRFDNPDYLYVYRKDNFEKNPKNPKDTSYVKENTYHKKKLKTKALLRVKYVRQTKDKELVFTIVKTNKHTVIPPYMYALLNRDYLYHGDLTKAQFKALFNRKLLCWDVRPTSMDNMVNLDIKTTKSHINLSGQVVTIRKDKSYYIPKHASRLVNLKMARLIKRDGRKFNKDYRHMTYNFNDANYVKNKNPEEYAYKHSLNFQTSTEKALSFDEWKNYCGRFPNTFFNAYYDETSNDVGRALLTSGLGIKNIDAYLHNGSMQDVFVRYDNVPFDSVSTNYSTILFKSINTNYPLRADYPEKAFNGYYFKNRPNYVIRFSADNILQVSKPQLEGKSHTISLDYSNQYNVRGMDSNQISKLILD